MTHAKLAQLELAIYGDVPDPGWERQVDDGWVSWAHYQAEGESVVVFEGSRHFRDWVRDLWAVPTEMSYPKLGFVHAGFSLGLLSAYALIKACPLKKRLTIAGHSLGAARAAQVAGLMAVDGRPPDELVLWGSPRPGFQTLADLVVGSTKVTNYRNIGSSRHGHGHDHVTDVPFHWPPLANYHPVGPYSDVCVAPSVRDDWGLFAWHHMRLYAEAMKGLV